MPDEAWINKQHEALDELIEKFRQESHTILDRTLASSVLPADGYILQDNSTSALPISVLIVACKKCKYRPRQNQKEWKAELDVLTKLF